VTVPGSSENVISSTTETFPYRFVSERTVTTGSGSGGSVAVAKAPASGTPLRLLRPVFSIICTLLYSFAVFPSKSAQAKTVRFS